MNMPIDVSLRLIEALHLRWVRLIESLSRQQLDMTYIHPEIGKVSLKETICLYAWHGKYHVGQINE